MVSPCVSKSSAFEKNDAGSPMRSSQMQSYFRTLTAVGANVLEEVIAALEYRKSVIAALEILRFRILHSNSQRLSKQVILYGLPSRCLTRESLVREFIRGTLSCLRTVVSIQCCEAKVNYSFASKHLNPPLALRERETGQNGWMKWAFSFDHVLAHWAHWAEQLGGLCVWPQ